MHTEISAIVCTYNQASYLQKSLASLIGQTLPKERFEIIVVDNGSIDHTREVCDLFNESVHLRYLYEPVVGLSQARNTGWRNARSEFVAFLDDDAIANPDWLERIVDRFKTLNPSPASVGGKILPIWEQQPPAWLTQELEKYLGVVNWINEGCFLGDEGFYLAGSNVAYRRQVLEEMGGFSTSLGRRREKLLSNEELLMQCHLKRRGLPIFYDPEISVQHHVGHERLKKDWFYKRFYWQGASDAILEYQLALRQRNNYRSRSSLIPILASLLLAMSRYAWKSVTRSSEKVAARCWIHHWMGRIWFEAQIKLGFYKA
jgi:glycosyltransferase involved in cell wall biosynthesis